MSFGNKLKQYRLNLGLSQEELAKKLHTTKQVISRYENEQRSPKLSVAVDIAARLGIPLEMLIDDSKPLDIGFILTEHEQKVITAYRNHPEMQQAVDTLLHVSDEGSDDDFIAEDIAKTVKAGERLGKLNGCTEKK